MTFTRKGLANELSYRYIVGKRLTGTYRKRKIMITPHKQWILEGITRTQKMEEMVATCDGTVVSAYSENRKLKGEGATADNFEIFMERGKMMSQMLVKNSWNEKCVENYF
jgi:hypothetical protein